MKAIKKIHLLLLFALVFAGCEHNEGAVNNSGHPDYSGVYCINMQNLEMSIVQIGNDVTFTLLSNLLTDGAGTLSGNVLQLTAVSSNSENFSAVVTFSDDGQSFTGPFKMVDATGKTTFESVLLGFKGQCPQYDIAVRGIPQFVTTDFTELAKIERISKFRSGFGHSFTDGVEACRSMKHYYSPYENQRENQNVKIFSPVDGTITSVANDGHGESIGLNNKQIQIRPEDQPAFTFTLFHLDLYSPEIVTGKKVQSGELLGYARLYYDDLEEYANSFDIAVWVNTPSGLRLISYFETLEEVAFTPYASRGASSRADFVISQQWRDAHPLECDGEIFINRDTPDDWVVLQ
jgi:hypothetical protein